MLWGFKISLMSNTMDKLALTIGALAGFLFGGWHELLTALIMIQALDILTGLLVGVKNKSLSSKKMSAGLYKKTAVWILIVFTNIIDRVLFDGAMIVQTAVCFAFISTEGLSLAENLGNMGIIIPDFIISYLEQVKNKGDISEKEV